MPSPLFIFLQDQALPERSHISELLGLQAMMAFHFILVVFVAMGPLLLIFWLRYRAAHPLTVPTSLEEALAEPEAKSAPPEDPGERSADWWK